MKRPSALVALVLVLLSPASACATADVPYAEPAVTPASAPPAPAAASESVEPNFLLLVSDEQNDIVDFSELWVTISGVGFVQGNEQCVVEYTFDEPASVNLVTLTGEDAVALWQGYVPEADYVKVFLYVDEAWGFLVDDPDGDPIEVKLPSNKLQVDAPVSLGDGEDGEDVTFVFDITVHRAGNSGQYVLSPQLSESGAGMRYRLLEQTEERLRIGPPDWAGKPSDAGGSSAAGTADGGKGTPDNRGVCNAANQSENHGASQQAHARNGNS